MVIPGPQVDFETAVHAGKTLERGAVMRSQDWSLGMPEKIMLLDIEALVWQLLVDF